jgi:hypothetical protein
MMKPLILLLLCCSLLAPVPAWSGEADVVDARARATAQGVYSFAVTVLHADTGWGHFADKWEVLAPDGTVLGTRVLQHPHVDEQPFTRSLSGVAVPPGLVQVSIRAHDSVHGWGGKTVTLTLPRGN